MSWVVVGVCFLPLESVTLIIYPPLSLSLRPIFFYSLFLFKVFFFTGVYQTQNDLALFPYIYRFRSMTPTHHIIPSGITSPMSPAIFLVLFFLLLF